MEGVSFPDNKQYTLLILCGHKTPSMEFLKSTVYLRSQLLWIASSFFENTESCHEEWKSIKDGTLPGIKSPYIFKYNYHIIIIHVLVALNFLHLSWWAKPASCIMGVYMYLCTTMLKYTLY